MRLIVGAPVCNRAWALPAWFHHLDRQTIKPDGFVFVCNPEPDDGTHGLLIREARIRHLVLGTDSTAYTPRHERNRVGTERAYTDFATRRNQLLSLAAYDGADVFLSLDTDIMLEDPGTIEQLLSLLESAPVSSPVTFLHQQEAESHCYNAGNWLSSGTHDPRRLWKRITPEQAANGVQMIEIPMAAVMMRREVIETCQYRYHECGEDLGFAQDLDRNGYRCLWDPSLHARHVWQEAAL